MARVIEFKLANVLLRADDYLGDDTELLYRLERGSTCAYDEADGSLRVSGLVDFATYLNGVSVGKWRRYADLDTIKLRFELMGDACTIATRALSGAANGQISSSAPTAFNVDACFDYREHTIEMPLECAVAGFALLVRGEARVRNAYYFTEIDEGRIRPVRLALCTTTYHKEDYIVSNINLIRDELIHGGEALAEGFHMFVVDNGRTLDVDALSEEWLSVIPNDNVGGSGGFARGLIAVQDHPGDFTHVAVMDDDVRVSPESFRRLFALLALVSDRYADAFVSGAMLELERPSLLFEDVSQMLPSGAWQKVKPDIWVNEPAGAVLSEEIDVELDHAYGGWWFNCMPMSAVNEHGLPLPFFVRFDDVEYGLRCQPVYLSMNGICVWHSGFASRFSASVACYQYVRNLFVMRALNTWINEPALLFRYWRAFQIWLRSLDYGAAELWLDGLEDYLRGPDFLMEVDGAQLMSENSAKCEKLVDVEQLDREVVEQLGEVDPEWLSGDYIRPPWRKIAASLPHDRHWMPDFLLSDEPGAVVPGLGESAAPWTKTAMRTRLVALLPDGSKGVVREMDRDRYRQLRDRYRSLMARYRREGAQVARQYREKQGEMTSRAYWENKLGL